MDLIREGSEFQAEGPATENALFASFVLVLGWAKRPRDAERKRSSLQMLHRPYSCESSTTRLQRIQNSVANIVLQQPALSSRTHFGNFIGFLSNGDYSLSWLPLPTKSYTSVLRHICLNACITESRSTFRGHFVDWH